MPGKQYAEVKVHFNQSHHRSLGLWYFSFFPPSSWSLRLFRHFQAGIFSEGSQTIRCHRQFTLWTPSSLSELPFTFRFTSSLCCDSWRELHSIGSFWQRSVDFMVALSSLAGISGEGLLVHCPPVLFLFFFSSGDPLAHTNSTFFLGQDQSTVAQQTETTVAKCFLTSCVWAQFPW